MSKDTLHRFIFDGHPVRGDMVSLDGVWQEVQARKRYPEPVRELLGQMLAAAALLSATIKIDGGISLQIQGTGPITLLVADATSARTLRGVARWRGEVPEHNFRALVGDGRLVITIDPGKGRERYQGIVELTGESLADSIIGYLERSEQLATRLQLVSDHQRAAGLLLQKLPGEADEDHDAWNRITTLAQTLTAEELLGLDAQEVLHRLFHEESLRLFDPEKVRFHCDCSRERVAEMLRTLGREEVDSIIAERRVVEVDCQFCNASYRFDAVDAEQLWHDSRQAPDATQ